VGRDRGRGGVLSRRARRRQAVLEGSPAADGRRPVLTVVFAAVIVVLAWYHWRERLSGFALEPVNLVMFGAVAWFLVIAHLHRDVIPGPGQAALLARLRLTVVVPLYNEDLATVREMLRSLASQTRLPQRVHLVNDGTPLAEGGTDDVLAEVSRWRLTAPASVEVRYDRIPNSGKRHAQAVAFRADPAADVFATVDSDTVLDPQAFEAGLAPFARPRVTAVAGLLLGLNYRANLLTRLVDLSFVSSFLIGRASWSVLSSVTVNCGGLSFYRAGVIRKWLPAYLSQTVMGKPVMFGDDRMLTTYALLEGRTCFQQSATGRTLLPANMSHLTRQRIRWWRSWYWGNMWIIRYFPMTRAVWWLVAWQYTSLLLWTAAWPAVLVAGPLASGHFPWQFFAYMTVLGWVRSIRYLTLRHPDRPFRSQLAVFALAPLSSLLSLYVCSVLQYAGFATFGRTGWGTRGSIEVGIGDAA
jgi:hyaluronan synthase